TPFNSAKGSFIDWIFSSGVMVGVPLRCRFLVRVSMDRRNRSDNDVTGNSAPESARAWQSYNFSTPHHSAMNSAVALVDFLSESRSTYSLQPCIPAPPAA